MGGKVGEKTGHVETMGGARLAKKRGARKV